MRATEFITEISRERLQSYLSGADQQVGRRLHRMSQARERLNRGYEIYDVNEPTRIIDRFEADTAQQARSYYADFIQNYNSDVDYEFGLRRGTGLAENFADGKGPGRPGDSQRHGIPKHATMAELEKASHAKGRKGQLARWQLNMRRGHKK